MTNTDLDAATFAGSCFWCMGSVFGNSPGVHQVIGVVRMNRRTTSRARMTGLSESIQITYDSSEIDYNELLEIFWRQTDPTAAEGSFKGRGQ